MKLNLAAVCLSLSALCQPIAAQPLRGSGIVTGFFTSPDICNPCSGLGTSSFVFGNPPAGSVQSSLTFVGANFIDVGTGEAFVAGQIAFQNGANIIFPTPNYVNLVINTFSGSGNPAFDKTQSFRLNLISTPNSSNPFSSADYVWINEAPNVGSFRAFENGQPAVFDIKGMFNSFEIVGIGAVKDPSTGFVTASTVASDFSPIPETGPTIVPEPESIALLALGLISLLAVHGLRHSAR
jgi:hypothetical protein